MLSAPSATIAATAFAGGASDGSWSEPEREREEQSDAELADRHVERRERANRSPRVEGRDRVARGRAEHGERADELAALLHADEERDADEADSDPDEPQAADALRRIDACRQHHGQDRRGRLDHGRQPGVDPRLREREEPVRHRVVERPEHDERDPHRAQSPGSPPRARTTGTSTATPTTSRPSDDDRGLDLVDAELDEEKRRAPDRREGEQEGDVAPMHRATLPAAYRAATSGTTRRARLTS